MSWLGLYHAHEAHFDPAGLDTLRKRPEQALLRGTIMLEATFGLASQARCLARLPWADGLNWSLNAHPNGHVVLTLGKAHVVLPIDTNDQIETLRLTYRWDIPAQTAYLAVEYPGHGRYDIVAAPVPAPLLLINIRRALLRPTLRVCNTVSYFAVSDRVEPVGPMPRLPTGTPILTPSGPMPVDHLKPGDQIITSDGQTLPVLHRVFRSVPNLGQFAKFRVRAPYLGLSHDLTVGAAQRLIVSGSEVEYMFGCERAFVSAATLATATIAHPVPSPDFVTYHHVVLPTHAVLSAQSAELESLYFGRLRRHPAHVQHSILGAADPRDLPEHAELAYPELQRCDAVALFARRAA